MITTSQQVLAVLSQRIGIFENQEIEEATNLDHEQVKTAIRTLVRRGFAERRGDLRVKATMAGLVFLEGGKKITSGPKGPRAMDNDGTSLRSRLWKAIRLAQKASASDLLELAARGSEGNAAQNAKEYMRALEKSGHLMRLSRRAPSEWPVTTGESRYCLVLNTGPLAPQFNRRQMRVFDPNTGKTYDLK
jgi:predicted transcriptional regulator